jgi:SecD/SecF fusion protein
MVMSDDTRAARLSQWAQEDEVRATEKHGYFDNVAFKVKRWAQCDRNRVINLGLDLQGGIQMVLSFDWRELSEEKIAAYRQDPNTDSDEEIETLVQEIVYQQLVNRIDEFEAKEPVIQKLGTNQIQVQLPGEKDTDRAIKLMTQAAVLNFHIVAGQDESVQVFTKIKQEFPNEFTSFLERPAPGEPIWVKPENIERVKSMVEKLSKLPGILPEDKMIAFSRPPKVGDAQRYDLYLLDKKPIATGDGLKSATSMPDPQNPSQWAISFSFDNAGAEIFGKATEANIGRPMAIVLDDLVVSAPTINGRIDFSGQITGRFDADEARDLAIALNSGSMVVKVREDSTDVVSASLGADSVKSGVTSALWGLALTGVCVVVYYMVPGAIALMALALNAIFVLAAMAYFGMTLTLPGIAGLILSIGMAVDANVLVFERMREELRHGHSVLSSIDIGFSKAAVAILDSNFTTFIAAIVLFQFGTGPIEGFAITLSIGVIATVFTGLVVGRSLFDFFYERRIIKTVKMLSAIKPDTRIPFMSVRNACMIGSTVLVVASLVLFGIKLNQGTMLGVDFMQGTNVRVNLQEQEVVDVAAIRGALNDAGFAGPTVQQLMEGDALINKFQIRVGDIDMKDAPKEALTVAQRLRTALDPLVGNDDAKVVFESVKTVGPAVGAQLRSDAIWAVVWSLLFIGLYIGYRFKLNYAMASVVALAHDVALTLGVFALFDRQISLAVVAAILTVMGYSLNDTIVVFDRIREDVDKFRSRGLKLPEIIDLALNSTLSRTLLTSVTTMVVVIMLFLFGGADIQDFALAMVVGIVAGTYSSIFVASPVVIYWEQLFGRDASSSEAPKSDDSGRRYIAKKKRAKKSDADGEATA